MLNVMIMLIIKMIETKLVMNDNADEMLRNNDDADDLLKNSDDAEYILRNNDDADDMLTKVSEVPS